MAKYNKNAVKKDSKVDYPSSYGSHASMLSEDYSEFNDADHEFVICNDARGSYVTKRTALDCGRCDYNRSIDVESREDTLKTHLHPQNA